MVGQGWPQVLECPIMSSCTFNCHSDPHTTRHAHPAEFNPNNCVDYFHKKWCWIAAPWFCTLPLQLLHIVPVHCVCTCATNRAPVIHLLTSNPHKAGRHNSCLQEWQRLTFNRIWLLAHSTSSSAAVNRTLITRAAGMRSPIQQSRIWVGILMSCRMKMAVAFSLTARTVELRYFWWEVRETCVF